MDSTQPLCRNSVFDVVRCVGNDTKDTLKCVLNHISNHLQMWFWSSLQKTQFMWFLLSRLPGHDAEKHIRAGSPNAIAEEQMTKKTFSIWPPALMRLKAAAGETGSMSKGLTRGWTTGVHGREHTQGQINRGRLRQRHSSYSVWFTIIIQGHWALWVQHHYWGP